MRFSLIINVVLLIVLSLNLQGQSSFKISITPKYEEHIQDSLYTVEISSDSINDDMYLMILTLVDMEQNEEIVHYDYYVKNPELSTSHNFFEKAGETYHFYPGDFTRKLFDFRGLIEIRDIDDRVLYSESFDFTW